MPLKHALSSGIADGGDASLVQPSNWNADHVLTSYFDFPQQTTDPAVPSAASSRVFSKGFATRPYLGIMNEYGEHHVFQSSIWHKNFGWWAASSGAGVTQVNLPCVITGTSATPALSLATNLQAQARRVSFTSASTASSGAGGRTNINQCYRGGAALSTGSPGGFYFAATCGTPVVLASSTSGFVGLRGTTAVIAGATNISTLTDHIGFGFDRGASVWAFYSAGSASAAGASTAMTGLDVSASAWHRFVIYNPTGTAGSTVYWGAQNLLTGSTASGTISAGASLPNAASLLSVHAHVNQNGAGSVALAVGVVYLETAY